MTTNARHFNELMWRCIISVQLSRQYPVGRALPLSTVSANAHPASIIREAFLKNEYILTASFQRPAESLSFDIRFIIVRSINDIPAHLDDQIMAFVFCFSRAVWIPFFDSIQVGAFIATDGGVYRRPLECGIRIAAYLGIISNQRRGVLDILEILPHDGIGCAGVLLENAYLHNRAITLPTSSSVLSGNLNLLIIALTSMSHRPVTSSAPKVCSILH